MSLAERSWSDSRENPVDTYSKNVSASTADNIMGADVKRPIVLTSISISVNQAGATGDVVLLDGSATGDTNTQKWRFVFASAATNQVQIELGHPLVFDTGLIVSATTCTGAINLGYKARHS